MFPTELAKVAFVISLFTGRTQLWGTAECECDASCCPTFKSFSDELKTIFDPARPEREASWSLLGLSQGPRPVTEYIIDFRTVAADSTWNDAALYDAFYQGLSECLKDELASRDLPDSLSSLMELVTQIDRRFCERLHERSWSLRTRTPPT